MTPIQGTLPRTPLGNPDTARRTEETQRAASEAEAAFEILKTMLPEPEYHRMESEWGMDCVSFGLRTASSSLV